MSQERIELNYFKDGNEEFLALLDENQIPCDKRDKFPPGTVMAAGGAVEIITAIGGASLIPSLAAVVIQWLKNKASRKVMLLTEDNQVVHLEGYSLKDVEKALNLSKKITIIQTKSD